MTYGEQLPVDSATKKFDGLLSNNGGTNEFVAKRGANLTAQNGETVADTAVASDQLPASLGQKTMAESLPVVIASDQAAIPVTFGAGENAASAAISLIAGTYDSGDCIECIGGGGSGLATIPTPAASASNGVKIKSIEVSNECDASIMKKMSVIIFSDDPSTSTFFAGSVPAIASDDVPKILLHQPILVADWTRYTNGATHGLELAHKEFDVPFAAANLYVVVICDEAITTTGQGHVRIEFELM